MLNAGNCNQSRVFLIPVDELLEHQQTLVKMDQLLVLTLNYSIICILLEQLFYSTVCNPHQSIRCTAATYNQTHFFTSHGKS